MDLITIMESYGFKFWLPLVVMMRLKINASSLASFPGLLCLQFLIACSMQKWKEKA